MSIYRTAWITACVAFASTACGAAQPSPTQEASVAAYAAEQEVCITASQTLEDSRACRLAVRKRWGRK